MASYRLFWKRSAEHDLRSIDRQQIPRIIEAVENLADNPFPPQHRKLRGAEQFYRIRVGEYRVVYQVDVEAGAVIIYYVRHRKKAYREV
ncbi:MAG: type II toxin-antitoxin system RelE/ParE family toxin [Candidatus Freyarchaeota archaeon]|nr:type II toxin-antitoxin system RelE/ParE family toxin [Candidatus Jordarchaeia archaeon]